MLRNMGLAVFGVLVDDRKGLSGVDVAACGHLGLERDLDGLLPLLERSAGCFEAARIFTTRLGMPAMILVGYLRGGAHVLRE